MQCRFGLLLILLCTSQFSFPQSFANSVINGYVFEEGSRTPIPSASLEITYSGMRAASSRYTGVNGEFSYGGLRDGDYELTIQKRGYETATIRVSVTQGSAHGVLTVHLRKEKSNDEPSAPGDAISAHELSIPQNARDSFEKGRKLLYDKSDTAKALTEFQRAIDEFSDYYEAYAQMGIAYYRLTKFSEGEQALRKSVELSSGKYSEALFLLAEFLDDQKRFSEAESVARQAIAADGTSWRGHYQLGRALLGLKRPYEAEASAFHTQQLNPNNTQVMILFANIFLAQRDYQSALKSFDAYLKLAPVGPESAQVKTAREQVQKMLEQSHARAGIPPTGP
jgi:cytochrome c-type biogenesis protein CcmH/NrfG